MVRTPSRERQRAAFVLEQHDARTRSLVRQLQVRGRARRRRRQGAVDGRIVEQPEPELDAEHAAHGPVDVLLLDEPRIERLRQHAVHRRAPVAVVPFVHDAVRRGLVGAGAQRQGRGLHPVARDPALDDEPHRPGVGHGEAVEPPPLPEQLGQQVAARRRRHPVVGGELDHDRLRAGAHGLAPRPQRHLLHVVSAAAGVGEVQPAVEVAGAGVAAQQRRHGAVRAQVVALQAVDELHAQLADQVGVLAVVLLAAAQARIADHVQVRREVQRLAAAARLGGDGSGNAAVQVAVPGAAHVAHRREDGGLHALVAAAVVVADRHRDAQARVLAHEAVHLVDQVGALLGAERGLRVDADERIGAQQQADVADGRVGEEPDEAVAHLHAAIGAAVELVRAADVGAKLHHLLLQRHALQEVRNPLLDGQAPRPGTAPIAIHSCHDHKSIAARGSRD